jgi:integrase
MANARTNLPGFSQVAGRALQDYFGGRRVALRPRRPPRTAYSLRHTYICLRLMEGADIYQIAKNCRASVEMIEKYYPAHKTRLDAAAINVMRRHNRRSKTGNTARER